MMATPDDLEDFGRGFSITEGIVERLEEIKSIESIENGLGIEVRMWLESSRAKSLAVRRRAIAGPVGCGLCGIESLEQACPPPRQVESCCKFQARDLLDAMRALPPLQLLNRKTRAVHAAAFWCASTGIAAVREDVGRHNALDKLLGKLALAGRLEEPGFVLMSSRGSHELVRKCARLGIAAMATISAPTSMGVRMAELSGLRFWGLCRAPRGVLYADGLSPGN